MRLSFFSFQNQAPRSEISLVSEKHTLHSLLVRISLYLRLFTATFLEMPEIETESNSKEYIDTSYSFWK